MNILFQVMLYDDENKCMIVSRVGTVPEVRALCIARTIPDGARQFEFEFPYKQFKKIVLTSDNLYFIAYGYDKLKVKVKNSPKNDLRGSHY